MLFVRGTRERCVQRFLNQNISLFRDLTNITLFYVVVRVENMIQKSIFCRENPFKYKIVMQSMFKSLLKFLYMGPYFIFF